MQPGAGGMQGEGLRGRAKGQSQLLRFSWSKKSRCCICMASCQLYGSTACGGHFSHPHTNAAMGLVSQGTGKYAFYHILNAVAQTDDFWNSVFLLMSSVGWLAVKNIRSDISYYLKTRYFFFGGCWIKFQLEIRAFCNYERVWFKVQDVYKGHKRKMRQL